jgi:hypothetical protein
MVFTEYLELFGLISFCAFFTYTVHEVINAIYSMIDDI